MQADVAQLVEHSLGKGEVIGSIPIISSRDLQLDMARQRLRQVWIVNAFMTNQNRGFRFSSPGRRGEAGRVCAVSFGDGADFRAGAVESFLRLLQRKGVPIRDFDRVLREKLLEQADPALGKSGRSARQWYDALSVGDQAQVREFYLTALETVDLPLREKYRKLYRYY